MMRRGLMVQVLQVDGINASLVGRAAAMAAWVAVYADKINAMPMGRVQFDWETEDVKPMLSEKFRRINGGSSVCRPLYALSDQVSS
jgi:hypothetical protein